MILVTGGLGYIGSHTVVELLDSGYEVLVVDDLSNSSVEVYERIKLITGRNFIFREGSILEKNFLSNIFSEYEIEAVIHFAAFKAVGESVKLPLKYYNNNIIGTLNVLTIMEKYSIKNLVFSSSATVYGLNNDVPFVESMEMDSTNPYGQTKVMVEKILRDLSKSDAEWTISNLRYFNPIGAHKSGLIGESPHGIPNNLMPYITQVAIGKRPYLNIFGNDYETIDGTGVRDYIHVVDLAKGHVLAIEKNKINSGLKVYNLGTGKGYSVLELVKTFEKATHIEIPYKITERRKGDIAKCYADTSKSKTDLGWNAEFDLSDMIKDSWNWQKKNPDGLKWGMDLWIIMENNCY